jgi:hypothetical protein
VCVCTLRRTLRIAAFCKLRLLHTFQVVKRLPQLTVLVGILMLVFSVCSGCVAKGLIGRTYCDTTAYSGLMMLLHGVELKAVLAQRDCQMSLTA